MSRLTWVCAIAAGLVIGCTGLRPVTKRPRTPQAVEEEVAMDFDWQALEEQLVSVHGEAKRGRIGRGLRQVAGLWRGSDGDPAAFAREHFLADPQRLAATLDRLEQIFEQVFGGFLEMGRELRRPTDVDVGPLLPVDPLLAAFDPSAHATEDLFRSKIAFVALLNFPLLGLAEKLERGAELSRREWAEARLTSPFARRIPAEIQQAITQAGANADLYIAQYNLWMHHLVDREGGRPFPRGLRLISHWNLRDEIRGLYGGPRGLERQRLIVQAMRRIVTQTIPAAVIDDPRVVWEPYSNEVRPAPAAAVEEGGRAVEAPPEGREPDLRYARLLEQFRAARRADPHSPVAPTQLARTFELSAEIPEERVVALLTELLTSPVVSEVAALARARLGRPLEPHDLWYAGFRATSRYPEEELDALTRARYPDAAAFERDLPRILGTLGFSEERAGYLAKLIRVDPSRGAGHAMGAGRRGDLPRLRTRIEQGGMDYKGYNIAVHELGHNVEQVFSLYDVDRTLLSGVPNTAFTEALAFVFQARDLVPLGLSVPDPEADRLRVLGTFWQAWEIAGVALVDIGAWHWMYQHPEATPAQLREAVVRISKEIWDRHYAPVLGSEGEVLLGIYSHMIAYPLYLYNYPLGHLIAFQIEEHLRGREAQLGAEFERMASFGSVAPDVWMINATGEPISAGPLLEATARALEAGSKAPTSRRE